MNPFWPLEQTNQGFCVAMMETGGSPWSTPTESELGAAEEALLKNNKALYEEIDFKVS